MQKQKCGRRPKMAIGKKKEEEQAVDHEIKVVRATQFKTGNIGFDMIVNGVKIYGCIYMQGTSKNGKEYAFVNFPQRKGDNGEYYNHVYVKLSEKDEETIEKALEAMVE
jgi:hypothetical protein